jgi:hypothetical protein
MQAVSMPPRPTAIRSQDASVFRFGASCAPATCATAKHFAMVASSALRDDVLRWRPASSRRRAKCCGLAAPGRRGDDAACGGGRCRSCCCRSCGTAEARTDEGRAAGDGALPAAHRTACSCACGAGAMCSCCLCAACCWPVLIAWLADPVWPWRGDSVLVALAPTPAWSNARCEGRRSGVPAASRCPTAMPTAGCTRTSANSSRRRVCWCWATWRCRPRCRAIAPCRSTLRTLPVPRPASIPCVAIVGERPEWRRCSPRSTARSASCSILQPNANDRTGDLGLGRTAAGEPARAAVVGGRTTPHSRSWRQGAAGGRPALRRQPAWPRVDFPCLAAGGRASARACFPPGAPALRPFGPTPTPPQAPIRRCAGLPGTASGALRDALAMALVALFALERILTHVRRR